MTVKPAYYKFVIFVLSFTFLFVASGCASKMSRLKDGALNQTDMVMMEDALPAYLPILDGLSEAYPKSESIQLLACQLYTAYGGILSSGKGDAKKRAAIAFIKAKEYAFKYLCKRNKKFAEAQDKSFDAFVESLSGFKKKDVPFLYSAAQAWGMWILSDGSLSAFTELSKIESMMIRSIELDETYNYGMARCFMGIVNSKPASYGGKLDFAKEQYEKALDISEGKYLLIHVFYAERYARLIYDRALHDKLLKYVVSVDINTLPKDTTIINIQAKEQAQKLLDSADEYF